MIISKGGGLESEITCHFGVFHHATMGTFVSPFFWLWVQVGNKASFRAINTLSFIEVTSYKYLFT
jgi:hypothetical protein